MLRKFDQVFEELSQQRCKLLVAGVGGWGGMGGGWRMLGLDVLFIILSRLS